MEKRENIQGFAAKWEVPDPSFRLLLRNSAIHDDDRRPGDTVIRCVYHGFLLLAVGKILVVCLIDCEIIRSTPYIES